MSPQPAKHVVVIGVGVIGLQTALTLLHAGYKVSVLAEYWPGDQVGGYTSPWAGAHWRTHATAAETDLCKWDAETYRSWAERVADEAEGGREGESGLAILTSLHYWDAPAPEIANGATSLWWAGLVSDFTVIPPSQLPQGVYYGVSFSTFAINVPRYLRFLLASVLTLGGKTVSLRLPTDHGLAAALECIQDLLSGSRIHAYVNATGIGAKALVGDENVEALRGQTVLVKGEAKRITTRLGRDKNNIRAIIPRPGSGTTIVGVSREPGVWDTTVSESTTRRLLRGGAELAPELLGADGEFEVVSVGVGLRPARRGGPRVEVEVLGGGECVVHAYGHAGAGYQNSIGSANEVLSLLRKHEEAKL